MTNMKVNPELLPGWRDEDGVWHLDKVTEILTKEEREYWKTRLAKSAVGHHEHALLKYESALAAVEAERDALKAALEAVMDEEVGHDDSCAYNGCNCAVRFLSTTICRIYSHTYTRLVAGRTFCAVCGDQKEGA